MPVGVKHLRGVLKELGKFIPLAVHTAAPHGKGLRLQLLENVNLELKFFDCPGRTGVRDDLFLGNLEFLAGGFVTLFEVFQVLSGYRAGSKLFQQN